MRNITISKGLDIPISGEVTDLEITKQITNKVAVLGKDYHDLKPTMLVKVGEKVIKGQKLLEDKKIPGLFLVAPISGEVIEINRGERRAFESLVIETDNNVEEIVFIDNLSSFQANKENVRDILIESGLWTNFKKRPFSKVPNVDENVDEIFISCLDTSPLSVDPEIFIEQNLDDFNKGIEIISLITSKYVHISSKIGSNLFVESEKVRLYELNNLHPAGNVGTQIHYISPLGRNKSVWTINYQHVCHIGHMFNFGRLSFKKLVSVAGPQVKAPFLLETLSGVDLIEVLKDKLLEGTNRIVSGSVLSGRNAAKNESFLGHFHNQISVLREVEDVDRELFNWFRPDLKKHSFLPVFFTKFFEKINPLNYTTSMNGADRAIVPIGVYEDVLPFNIMATQLLKSIVLRDTEEAQDLGILELDEEDLSLATYVCPSKYDYGSILRENLKLIEDEG